MADIDSGTADDSDIAVGLAWLLAQDPPFRWPGTTTTFQMGQNGC